MSRRTERQIAEDNRLLDGVMSDGHERAFEWLRAAYHTHRDRELSMLDKYDELRRLFLANVQRALTVREAQLCRVCRICRGANRANDKGPFRLDFGEEHAHESCLRSAGSGDGGVCT